MRTLAVAVVSFAASAGVNVTDSVCPTPAGRTVAAANDARNAASGKRIREVVDLV